MIIKPTPKIPENSYAYPSGGCAELVETGSVETLDSFCWAGAKDSNDYVVIEGTDYVFVNDKTSPAASDSNLVVYVPVTLNASDSSYTASRPTC